MVEKKIFGWLRLIGSVICFVGFYFPLYSYSYPDAIGQYGSSTTILPVILLISVGIYSLPGFLASFLLLLGIASNITMSRPKARYVIAFSFLLLVIIGWQDMISVSAHVHQFAGGFQIGFVVLLFGVLCCLSEDVVRSYRFMADKY